MLSFMCMLSTQVPVSAASTSAVVQWTTSYGYYLNIYFINMLMFLLSLCRHQLLFMISQSSIPAKVEHITSDGPKVMLADYGCPCHWREVSSTSNSYA
ncbi:hypothetical protein DFS33DRAFT_1354623 [Desarmillaria ectypa]|nr:hypothetical protein DFS33DRAFT_1354623 [Desarmillaria ectypa]